MKKALIKNKYLVIIVLIVAGLFYWFQIRPAMARSECDTQSREYFKTHTRAPATFYNYLYEACLHQKGL